MGSFNSTADLLLEHLSTMADGQTEIHMFNQFTKAALDVICKVINLYIFLFCLLEFSGCYKILFHLSRRGRGGRGSSMFYLPSPPPLSTDFTLDMICPILIQST